MVLVSSFLLVARPINSSIVLLKNVNASPNTCGIVMVLVSLDVQMDRFGKMGLALLNVVTTRFSM